MTYRIRKALEIHGHPTELSYTEKLIKAELQKTALHLNIALLAASEEQAKNWESALSFPAVRQEKVHPRLVVNPSISFHVQNWNEPLAGSYDEIHVIEANLLSTERIAKLASKTKLLSLHTIGGWSCRAEEQHWSNWDSVETIAIFLKSLIGTLRHQAMGGFSWKDYLQLRQHRDKSTGSHIGATDWRHVVDELLLKAKKWPASTSALIFLNVREDVTLGEYAEAATLLDTHLSDRCLISIGNPCISGWEVTLLTFS